MKEVMTETKPDSEHEFEWWAEELIKRGYIDNIVHHPHTFMLIPKAQFEYSNCALGINMNVCGWCTILSIYPRLISSSAHHSNSCSESGFVSVITSFINNNS